MSERIYLATEAKQNTIISNQSTAATSLAAIKAKVDTLSPSSTAEKFADNTCIVNVTINALPGYELPEGEAAMATMLDGAYVAVMVDGYAAPLKSAVTSLTGYSRQLVVPCTTASRRAKVFLHLGKSDTVAYTADSVSFSAIAGETYSINLQTENTTGETVELVRIQPYTSTAAGAGTSYLGTRITNSTGSHLHVGENSLTSVTVYNCEKNADGQFIKANPRQIVSGGDGAVDIMQRLNVFKNIRKATVTFTGDSNASIDSTFIRFEQVWVKTTLETIDGVLAVCKWFCDKQADPDYHLHPLFIRYERQADGTMKETPTKYGYIARYPLNNYTLKIGGQNQVIAVSRSDNSNEVGNTRAGFLATCRRNNASKITISVADEADVVITPNSDDRCASMIDLREISFLQLMSYLFFGIDSQSGMKGICAGDGSGQKNGLTDYAFNAGYLNGGEDTESNICNFSFLGIEGGCWSAPGIMYPNFTSIFERVTTTNADGVASSSTNNHYIMALDRNDYKPDSNDEEDLLESGYRRVSFNISGNRRMGYDDSPMMRDAFLPTVNAADKNIHIGIKDGEQADSHWSGSAPAAIAAYSASTIYAVGALVIYNTKLYKCTTAVATAEAFDESKWSLQTNEEIKAQNYYMVALGAYRNYGSSLGSFSLYASSGLSLSHGATWRSRLSLQVVS